MIFRTVDEFVEVKEYRKALNACMYVAKDEGYLTEENFDKLEKFIYENKTEELKKRARELRNYICQIEQTEYICKRNRSMLENAKIDRLIGELCKEIENT